LGQFFINFSMVSVRGLSKNYNDFLTQLLGAK
jgi:hypothetical protein